MQMPRSTEFKSTDLKSRHTGWLSSTCKGKKTKCNLHGRWWFLHNSLNFLIWITFQNLPALRSTPQVEILRSGGWETTNWKQPRLNNWQLWFKGKKSSSFLKQRSMYLPGNYSANHWQLHIIQSYPKPAFSTEVQLAGFVRKVYTVTRFEAFPKISCLVLFYLPQKVRRYFPQLHDSAPPPRNHTSEVWTMARDGTTGLTALADIGLAPSRCFTHWVPYRGGFTSLEEFCVVEWWQTGRLFILKANRNPRTKQSTATLGTSFHLQLSTGLAYGISQIKESLPVLLYVKV